MSLKTKAALLHFFPCSFAFGMLSFLLSSTPRMCITDPAGRTFSETAHISLCAKMTTSFVCEVPRYPAGTLVNEHRHKIHATDSSSRQGFTEIGDINRKRNHDGQGGQSC